MAGQIFSTVDGIKVPLQGVSKGLLPRACSRGSSINTCSEIRNFTSNTQAMLEELLLNVERFAEARALFEGLATRGVLSALQDRLLARYVRSNNRRKAKDLISELPAEWIESDKSRSLAVELAGKPRTGPFSVRWWTRTCEGIRTLLETGFSS